MRTAIKTTVVETAGLWALLLLIVTATRAVNGWSSDILQQKRRSLLFYSQDPSSSFYDPTVPDSEQKKSKKDRNNDDVIQIGKSSAKQGAVDYVLDPSATEETYMASLDSTEKQVYTLTEQGLSALRSFLLEDAVTAFDQVFALQPRAHVWQAGIAYYYVCTSKTSLPPSAGSARWEDALAVLSSSAAWYERTCDAVASEERLWWYAVELRRRRKFRKQVASEADSDHFDQLTEDQQKPSLPPVSNMISPERRRVLRLAHTLFAAAADNGSQNMVTILRARALLVVEALRPRKMDVQLRRLQSCFYLGLYHDARGDDDQEDAEWMRRALQCCVPQDTNDLVHALPVLHTKYRDDFDNRQYDGDDEPSRPVDSESFDAASVYAVTIQEDVKRLKRYEIVSACRHEGLKVVGSKEQLQKRLARHLVERGI